MDSDMIANGPFTATPLIYRRGQITHRVQNKLGYTAYIGSRADCQEMLAKLNERYAAWVMAKGTAAEGLV